MRTARGYQATGIVIKRRNIGESDRIITLFTPQYGKVRLVVRGVRKITSRRAGHLEIFSLVSLTARVGKLYDSITEAQQRPFLETVHKNLTKVSHAYYICELVDVLTQERQGSSDVYNHLYNAFVTIDKSEDEEVWNETVFLFALRLLWTLGFLPRSQEVSRHGIDTYIERIIEKKLKTRTLLTKMMRES